jgi:hypothetical protein
MDRFQEGPLQRPPFPGPHPVLHDRAHDWVHWVFLGWEVLFFLAVIVAIVVVIRALTRSPMGTLSGGHRSPALAELDLRYARGEVSREEYFQRRADLIGTPTGGAPTPPPK